MPWILEIHTIDAGRGESSLIIARNAATGVSRSMLIDGGRTNVSSIVNDYVRVALHAHGLNHLDHIVTSHYDVDHSEGISQILNSDNLEANAAVIGNAAGAAAFAAAGQTVLQQIAAGAAAAVVATGGGYDHPNDSNDADQAAAAGQKASQLVIAPGTSPAEAAAIGQQSGRTFLGEAMINNSAIVWGNSRANSVAKAAGQAAGVLQGTSAARSASAAIAARRRMATGALPTGQFQTFGFYRSSNVIDTGDQVAMPDNYGLAISDQINFGGMVVEAIGVDRARTSLGRAQLGAEILWGTGNSAMLPPDNAPTMHLVAANAFTWDVPPNPNPIGIGADNNADSLAFVLRFGNFWFYTGGDLPSDGEERVGTAVRNLGLPNPAGGTFAPPAAISAFKCGHHGANTSTSVQFLNTIQPSIAFISCDSMYEHPGQTTINNLLASAPMQRFYLTNCKFATLGVPASIGLNQLVPPNENGSRVCGDNGANNLQPGRHRGNIKATVTQAMAGMAPGPGRSVQIEYFDNDDMGLGHGVIGARVEATRF